MSILLKKDTLLLMFPCKVAINGNMLNLAVLPVFIVDLV